MARRAVHILSPLPATEALRVLARALIDSPPEFERRVAITPDNSGRAVIEIRTKHARLDHAIDPVIEGRIYEAYNTELLGPGIGRREPADIRWKIELAEEAPNTDLFRQMATIFGQAIDDAQGVAFLPTAQLAEPLEHCLFALALGRGAEIVAPELTEIEWRSTGVVMSGYGDGGAMVARLGVDPRYGSTQQIAAEYAHYYSPHIDLFVPYEWAAGMLLVEPGALLDDPLRHILGHALKLVRERQFGEHKPFVLFVTRPRDSGGDGPGAAVIVVIAELPGAVAMPAATAVDKEGISRLLDVQVIELRQDVNATARLRDLMERHAEDIGYRLELHHLPSYDSSAADLEEVQRLIEELETRRSFLLGETAEDWRLLRFPADGLQAMIDFLRRFPLEVADERHMSYAFHASTTDTRGVHYLLYRSRNTSAEPPYPDAYWSRLSGGGTIVHRVDPLFAQFLAAQTASSLVFTPENYVVSPNFRSTQYDVDKYLQEGFSRLLGSNEIFQQLVAGQPAAGVYVIGFNGKGEVRLEVMDRLRFQPIGRVVPLINSNLELSPRVDLEDFVARGADAAWRKERLEALDAGIGGIREASARKMAELDRDLAEQAGQLVGAMTTEIDAIRQRIDKLLGVVEELAERAGQVEIVASEAILKAGAMDVSVENLPPRFAELSQTRERVQQASVHLEEATSSFVSLANERVRSMRAALDGLEQELRNGR